MDHPGTGKTLLAKAVANQTSATFLRVVGSELVTLDSVTLDPALIRPGRIDRKIESRYQMRKRKEGSSIFTGAE